jgi:hypothetical protein
MAERVKRGPRRGGVFAALGDNLPDELRKAWCIGGFDDLKGFLDSAQNIRTIGFDTNLPAHDRYVMSKQHGTKASQGIDGRAACMR